MKILFKMKKPTVSKLKKKLDKVFSQYIRNRDRLEGSEYAQCVTCGKVDHWKRMQAGHFISRRFNSTRYDERNVNCQDYACNVGRQGNPQEYWLWMEDNHGREVIDELIAKKNETKRFTISELQDLIQLFNNKLKQWK